MKRSLFVLLFGTLFALSSTAAEKAKLSLLLDWFVNPDHAAIIVAQQKGFFAKHNLEVEIIEPADPSLPPKLVAANKADLAVDYQPQLYQQIEAGLPLVRVGTLIASPLNTLMVLQNSGIRSIADLKGKKIGYSVSGFENILLETMLSSANVDKSEVQLVNVNWSLSPSLLTGQVDAVIGGLRNFELNQLALEKSAGLAFFPEEHGVPVYDELILVANQKHMDEAKIADFLTALEEATVYLINHPNEAWQDFVSYKPKELANELNRLAWKDTLPYLALRPRAFDGNRYQRMAEFMQQKGVIKSVPDLKQYVIEIKENHQ